MYGSVSNNKGTIV